MVADEEFEKKLEKKIKWLTKNDGTYKKIWIFFPSFFLVLLEITFCESESSTLKNKKIHYKVREFFSIA